MARKKYKEIGKRFRELRRELDTDDKECTQDALAKQIYIQKPQISELENGKRLPSINELKAYCKYFTVPMEYLLELSPNRKYENMYLGAALGLSDKVINHLKGFQKSKPSNNIVYILNYIFEIDYGYPFLHDLSNYFFAKCDKFRITENKIENGFDKSKIYENENIEALSYDMKTTATIKSEDVEFIFQQKLYKLLAKIKNTFKENGFECKTDSCSGFNIGQSERDTIMMMQELEQGGKNGKHTTKKK